jgi:release factor glutamine methyltransferase
MLPLPAGTKVDVILSNPAQLPLPQQDRENSPFYAGPDGRSMIDALIREAPMKLNPSGHLLMTHNSLANLKKSLTRLKSVGLWPSIWLNDLFRFGHSSIVLGSTNWAARPKNCIPFGTA